MAVIGTDTTKSANAIVTESDVLTGDSETTLFNGEQPANSHSRCDEMEWSGVGNVARPQMAEAAAGKARGRFEYTLDRRLGSGGFGSVYLATCDSDASDPECPPRTVALKMVGAMPGADPCKMLKRELSAMLALRHDRIPRVYDWHCEPPWPFVVFEYFPHGSLHDKILLDGGISEDAAWRLLADLSGALTAAHRASILHLDVKPANVLLDAQGGFVLTDFGISQGHLVARGITETGLGAPLYQSPEQQRADHDSFNAATDLWGVGMTAWVAISGLPVSQLKQYRLSEGDLGMVSLSEVAPNCSAALEQVVMSLLQLEQGRRPASAAEVLARVQAQLLDSAVVEIRPEPAGSVVEHAELAAVIDGLMDALWAAVCAEDSSTEHYRRFEDAEVICREGESSYYAYVLLKGRIRVEKNGSLLSSEAREGSFVGELTTLTGRTRTATLTAEGRTWVRVFNSVELERFIIRNPAVGIRLVKTLADRLCATLGR